MKQSNYGYQQTEYFRGNPYKSKTEDISSLNVDSEINSTIKKNNERANVEIEGKELVLAPDLSSIHRAVGKKHSQGGIPVNLKPESFIFSDDKTLAVTEQDHELFELKKGGKFRPKDNTPAKVLEKNVDIKHYNKLVTNISNKYKDEISKQSSAMMLDKYVQTVGNVAYIQEAKKGFPQGLPEFAAGTAPVYDTQLKDEIMEIKQYAKYGGIIENPYKIKAQLGLTVPNSLKRRSNKYDQAFYGANNPYQLTHRGDKLNTPDPKTGLVSNTWNRADDEFPDLNAYARAVGYPATAPHNPSMIQQWVKDTYPDLVAKHHGAPPPGFGMPNAKKEVDSIIGVRWKAIAEDIKNMPKPAMAPAPKAPVVTPPAVDRIDPNPIEGGPQGGLEANWNFTPWQKISQGYNAMKWAGTKRYMPYRSQFNATYAEPALLNPEQAVGDMKNMVNTQMNASRTMNPYLAGANNAATFGRSLDAIASIRGQYDNQNVQIMNQSRAQNAQTRNHESMMNMQNDQQYYQQAVQGRQNFDNARSFAGDQWMNNVLRDVETNQSLSYNMMTQNNPAYGYDFKTGNFYRNKKNIMDSQGSSSEDTMEAMIKYAESLKNSGLDPAVQSAIIRSKAFSSMAPYMGNQPSWGQMMGKQKKGGRINPYK